MTLGERLARLRREGGYTQEQLAERLGVSRQSVSKWESDLSYPETEKLLHLGALYGCSMDHLLKGTPDAPNALERAATAPFDLRSFYFERKSKKTVKGLPLWHINIGLGRTAKGVLAIGLCAKGVVSLGVFSLGLLSFGCFALGMFAFGAFALGMLAAGAIAVGVLALGAISVGLFAIGAIAVGGFSVGALSVGHYFALGENARGAIAIGRREAVGTLYRVTELTADTRQEVIRLLDQSVPTALAWCKALAMQLL